MWWCMCKRKGMKINHFTRALSLLYKLELAIPSFVGDHQYTRINVHSRIFDFLYFEVPTKPLALANMVPTANYLSFWNPSLEMHKTILTWQSRCKYISVYFSVMFLRMLFSKKLCWNLNSYAEGTLIWIYTYIRGSYFSIVIWQWLIAMNMLLWHLVLLELRILHYRAL